MIKRKATDDEFIPFNKRSNIYLTQQTDENQNDRCNPISNSNYKTYNEQNMSVNTNNINIYLPFGDSPSPPVWNSQNDMISDIMIEENSTTSSSLCAYGEILLSQSTHSTHSSITYKKKSNLTDYFIKVSPSKIGQIEAKVMPNIEEEEDVNMCITSNSICKVCNIPFTDHHLSNKCTYCIHNICQNTCTLSCEMCSLLYCKYCVAVSYSDMYERTLCPDCTIR